MSVEAVGALDTAKSGPEASTPRQGRTRPRSAHLLAVVVLLALTAAFFHPLFRGRTFSTVGGHQNSIYPWRASPNSLADSPQSDQADLSYPWDVFSTRALRGGSLPFWNPYSFGGEPFFANGSSATASPLHVLSAFSVPVRWAHDVVSFAIVFLAGLCMFLLARDLGAELAGSTMAATSWMFSSFNLAWLHLEVVAPVAVFLPLGMLCVRRVVLGRSRRAVPLSGMVAAACLLSGHLIFMVLTVAAAACYGAVLSIRQGVTRMRGTSRRRFADALLPGLRLVYSLLIGAGLSAFVLLPTSRVVTSSARRPYTYEEARRALVVPLHTLRYLASPPPLPPSELRMHQMAFAGTLTFLLAVIGLFRRRPATALGAPMVAGTIAVAVGTPLTWLVFHAVPGMSSFHEYGRLFFLSSFGICLLAASGADTLAQRTSRWRQGRRHGHRQRRWRPAAGAAVWAACGLTVAQVLWYGHRVNPPFQDRRQALVFPETPLIRSLRPPTSVPRGWPRRVLSIRAVAPDGAWQPPVLYAAESMVFGIESMGGYDSVSPRRTSEVISLLQGGAPEEVVGVRTPSGPIPSFDAPTARLDLAGRFGVTTVIAGPGVLQPDPASGAEAVARYRGLDGEAFDLPDASPGPHLVHRFELASGARDALRRFADPAFDHRSTMVVERTPAAARPGVARVGAAADLIRSASKSPNRLRVRLDAARPGWLVIPDMWDAGWRAEVNGHRARIERADFNLRAVAVPAGPATVTMRYVPEGFVTGAIVTALTGAVSAVILVTGLPGWRRSRRHRRVR